MKPLQMDRLYMTILWIDYTLYEYTTYVLHHVLKLVGVARTGPSEEERKLGAAEEVPLTQKKQVLMAISLGI